VRNTELGEKAAAAIRTQHPDAKLAVMACDLSSLKSVKAFAKEFGRSGKPCHVLMCNAGVCVCATCVRLCVCLCV
jgi:NAD(P)-dependent dehydrogenase (short-subunit alcohol dehydrogenase family)